MLTGHSGQPTVGLDAASPLSSGRVPNGHGSQCPSVVKYSCTAQPAMQLCDVALNTLLQRGSQLSAPSKCVVNPLRQVPHAARLVAPGALPSVPALQAMGAADHAGA